MSSSVQLVLAAIALSILAVFNAAFRFAMREHGNDPRLRGNLPRAELRDAGRRGRTFRASRVMQAAFIALGITSIFVMIICALGMFVLSIAA